MELSSVPGRDRSATRATSAEGSQAELAVFQSCRTAQEHRRVLRAQVDAEVERMLALVADADAFDVIELMRMREFPVAPLLAVPDGTALNVEIVAAMLLGRPSRTPSPTLQDDTSPHLVVSELHDRADRLARLAALRRLSEASLSSDPFALLAAQYQSTVLLTRNLQYDSIRDQQDMLLFDNAIVESLMLEHLGYTYPDVVAVRSAMKDLSGERMTSLRDALGDFSEKFADTPLSDVPADVSAAFESALVSFMFRPGRRSAMTPKEVADHAGISVSAAQAVMRSSAQGFDPTVCPAERVYELLTSTNPFAASPLVSDGAGNYAETTTGVGLDSLRRTVETALTGTKHWNTYDKKVRQVVSERLALQALHDVLRTPPALTGFKYYAPRDDESHDLLSRDGTRLNDVGKVVEGDGLFVVGDVAICVEVKGKSMSAPARRGDVRRLWNDLRATVGNGYAQAARLQALIERNSGVWLADSTWYDLSHVREVRSVVALLDDVGPLGTNLGDHVATGLLPAHGTPWVVSLHDLQTITQVCDRPSEFLLYLRRRTDSDVTTYYKSADELDLFMLFMDADLYIEPDPDELRALYPTMPRDTRRARKAHAKDAVFTFVGDQCADLDAWMSRDPAAAHAPLPSKPTYRALPRILDLVDAVESHGNGMIRFGADVFALAEDTQQSLLNGIDECLRRTRKDGRSHDGMLSFAGVWGHPTVFIGTRPRGASLESVLRRLTMYIRLKRHQLRSDRSYGLIFDEDGDFEVAMYLNTSTEGDSDLDALVQTAGLRPVGTREARLPPSARRTRRRLRGGKKRR